MISALIWNIRGIASKLGLRRLKQFVKLHHLKLIVIVEPMVALSSLPYNARMLGFSQFCANCANKIWVFWADTIHASMLRDHAQCLSFSFTFPALPHPICGSFVYVKNTRIERRCLWDELLAVDAMIDMPWFVGGDFNVIKARSEKLGGASPNLNTLEEFNDCLLDCGLLDVPFTGNPFTWTNGTIFQRLDRIVVNAQWGGLFDTFSVSHLARDGSDHCPMLFSCLNSAHSGPSSFKFLNMWTSHHDFLNVVKTSWDLPLDALGVHRFWFKQQHLKSELKRWNKHDFGDIFAQLKSHESACAALELAYQADPCDLTLTNLNKGNALLNQYLSYHEQYWQQKSGCKWLVDGERNTHYYHMLVKKKHVRNRIFSIQEPSGTVLTSLGAIHASTVSYFTSMFSHDALIATDADFSFIPPLLSVDDNAALNRVPTTAEIKEVIFDSDIYSTAGPDGFSALFFQSCWHIICDDLCGAVVAFFEGEHLGRGITSTNIALIPKKDNPQAWTDF